MTHADIHLPHVHCRETRVLRSAVEEDITLVGDGREQGELLGVAEVRDRET